MELAPYIQNLRGELGVAAEAGGEDARALAERLVAPLESAVRLTLLDALSDAADEITRDLAPGSVELRLRGGEPAFVVTPAPADDAGEPEPDAAPLVATEHDDGETARINLRLPGQLKAAVERAASGEGLSVNAWLVRATAGALHTTRPNRRRPPRGGRIGDSYSGWVR